MNKLEYGKISSSQLTFMLIAFIFGTSTLLVPGGGAKNNAWLAVSVGMLEGLFFAFIHISLTRKYPGQTLVEINDAVYGPYLGKGISVLYILFFMHVAGLVISDFFEFFSLIMPETPSVVFAFSLLFVCAWGIKCGIEVIARVSILVVPLIIVVIILDTVFAGPLMNLSNLLPFLDISALEFFKASHATAAFPYGETVVFLMVYAFINKTEETGKSVVQAFLITGLFFLIAGIRNISVLGVYGQDLVFPSFSMVRLINIGEVINRVDILVAVSILSAGFIKAAILYYGPVLGAAQILKMKSYQPLVLPIGALILNLSLMSFENFPTSIRSAMELYSFYSMPFIFFLPLITLIIAQLRKIRSGTE